MRIGPLGNCGDWIRVFVVVTVAPPGAEPVLHQSSVACGPHWYMEVVFGG